MSDISAGQLTQIYNIAKQQGCEFGLIQWLIEKGYLADFFAAPWQRNGYSDTGVDRTEFRRSLCLDPQEVKVSFEVWYTVKIGTGLKTTEDFLQAMGASRHLMTDGADRILYNSPEFTVSETEQIVDLVETSTSDLGFKRGGYLKHIYRQAHSLGLRLCSAEVAPQMCVQWKQHTGVVCNIGMKPIPDPRETARPIVFKLERNHSVKDLYLGTTSAYPNSFSPPTESWVFVKPRK
ncbi:MAG: hypothetical protein WCT19_01585 [Candidatus Paceibacterota bacterium]|jgi:hypothetical protein